MLLHYIYEDADGFFRRHLFRFYEMAFLQILANFAEMSGNRTGMIN